MTSKAPIERRAPKLGETPLIVQAEYLLDQLKQVSDTIATRAYQLFEGRGHQIGNDVEDWLRAELELLRPVPIDITESNDQLTVQAKVPGFRAEQIQVSAEPRRLIISGKAEERMEDPDQTQLYSKDIIRAVELPCDVDPAVVTAKLRDGILTITLPKIPRAEPAHAEVTTG